MESDNLGVEGEIIYGIFGLLEEAFFRRRLRWRHCYLFILFKPFIIKVAKID